MTENDPEDGTEAIGNAPKAKKQVRAEDVDRGFIRPEDLRRLEFARDLLSLGMHSASINALLPAVSPGRIKKIAAMQGISMHIGRPTGSAAVLIKRATLQMDATLFAITYQAMHAMASSKDGANEAVSVPVLIDAYRAFASLYAVPSLDINLAYVVVRDLQSKALSLDRCKLHETEYLRSAVQVQVSDRYSHGECPHCRAA